MCAALAYLDDDLQMPRPARHLYLVAVDGRIIEHATPPDTSPQNRSRAACMRTGTSALPLIYANSSFYDKGLLLSETMFDAGGQRYVETENTYEFWKLGDALTNATDPLDLNRFGDRASATLFPRLIRTDKRFYANSKGLGSK